MFNALLIARAPLQLFQAVQTSLLPHLAGLEATEGADDDRAIRVTIRAIAAFAGAVRDRPARRSARSSWTSLFGEGYDYGRFGLAAARRRHGLPPRRRARSTRPRWPAAGPPRRPRAWLARRRGVRRSGCCCRSSTTGSPRRGRLPRRRRPGLRATAGRCTAPPSSSRDSPAVASLVGQRLEHVEPGRAPSGERPRRPRRRSPPRTSRRIRLPNGMRQREVVQRPAHDQREQHARATTPRIPPMHRGDDRLVADHPAHLATRGADRTEHAELARALGDREHERVDDPEQRDDDRQRQQRVDEREDLVDLAGLVVDELLVGERLGLREVGLEPRLIASWTLFRWVAPTNT